MTTTAKTTTTSTATVSPSKLVLLQSVIFSPGAVVQFHEDNFYLNTKELICLKYQDCVLVLFYANNKESRDIAEIWASAASEAVGATFAACNLSIETKVADNFAKLRTMPDHVFYWAHLRGVPFILVYRDGWPKACYQGQLSTQPILDYALTLACVPGYEEHCGQASSIKSDYNLMLNVNKPATTTTQRSTGTIPTVRATPSTAAPSTVGTAPVVTPAVAAPTSSTQFTIGSPVRSYTASGVREVSSEDTTPVPQTAPVPTTPAPVPTISRQYAMPIGKSGTTATTTTTTTTKAAS